MIALFNLPRYVSQNGPNTPVFSFNTVYYYNEADIYNVSKYQNPTMTTLINYVYHRIVVEQPITIFV